jgi:Na+-transporting NADH:ubiquinone oxidoreductase subunit NqrB
MKRAAIVLVLSSLACVVAFEIIGSSVNEDGTLVEPFFLIPIAWLLFVTGVILGIATFIKGRLK